MKIFFFGGGPSVEGPHAEVEIGREADPQQIGQLQPGGRFVAGPEEQEHGQYQPPQGGQPHQREAVGLGVEEDEAPAEIEGQLHAEHGQSPGPGGGRGASAIPGPPPLPSGRTGRSTPRGTPRWAGRGAALRWFWRRGPPPAGSASRRGRHRLNRQNTQSINFPWLCFHAASPGVSLCTPPAGHTWQIQGTDLAVGYASGAKDRVQLFCSPAPSPKETVTLSVCQVTA